MAYKLGLKGIAYMREGSRTGVLERIEEKKPEVKIEAPVIQKPTIVPRPMMVHGATYRIDTPVGRAYITINTNENGDPLENGVSPCDSARAGAKDKNIVQSRAPSIFSNRCCSTTVKTSCSVLCMPMISIVVFNTEEDSKLL